MLENDMNQIKDLVTSLTQLFFGLESLRNPGTMVINQMALDLIIKHGYSFKQMLTRGDTVTVEAYLNSKYAPDDFEEDFEESCNSHILSAENIKHCRSGGMMQMSHAGVLAVARKLESSYQVEGAKFMPKPYRYQGSQATETSQYAVRTELELITLEGKIINEWLRREEGEMFSNTHTQEEELTLLENSVKERVDGEWFKGITIDNIKQMRTAFA